MYCSYYINVFKPQRTISIILFKEMKLCYISLIKIDFYYLFIRIKVYCFDLKINMYKLSNFKYMF